MEANKRVFFFFWIKNTDEKGTQQTERRNFKGLYIITFKKLVLGKFSQTHVHFPHTLVSHILCLMSCRLRHYDLTISN